MFPDLITDDAFRLETRRLWLRWPRVGDAVTIAKLAGVKAVSHFTTNLPHPYNPKDAETFIMAARKGNLSGKQTTLVLTCKGKPGEAIGVITLRAQADGGLTTAYWLGEPYWKQGLMGEALDEVLALGFTATTAQVVRTIVRKGNMASERLLETRGFTILEKLQVNMPARGGIFACNKFILDRSDWQMHEMDRFRSRSSSAAKAKTASRPSHRSSAEVKMCA